MAADINFRYEGIIYRFSASEMTGALERELWQATKLTVQDIAEALGGGARFAVAALVWLSRRQRGEKVAYVAVEHDLDAAIAAGDVDLEILDGASEEEAGPPVDAAS